MTIEEILEAGITPTDTTAPEPEYHSWYEFLCRVPMKDIRRSCNARAKSANRSRPAIRVSGEDIWQVMSVAEGRCFFCGSFAVEKRPSKEDGSPLPWEHVGRRIGAVGHWLGEDNDITNLIWSCLWCNTFPNERIPDATDHGAITHSWSHVT